MNGCGFHPQLIAITDKVTRPKRIWLAGSHPNHPIERLIMRVVQFPAYACLACVKTSLVACRVLTKSCWRLTTTWHAPWSRPMHYAGGGWLRTPIRHLRCRQPRLPHAAQRLFERRYWAAIGCVISLGTENVAAFTNARVQLRIAAMN